VVLESCKEIFSEGFSGGLKEAIAQCPALQGIGFGVLGGIIAIGIFVAIIFILAIYVYRSIAWMKIARKLKYKHPWMVWIPIINLVPVLQLGGFGWGWIFLMLIPILGWAALFVMFVISLWRIFEKRKYPGWYSLSVITPKVGTILYLIAIGFLAWKDKKKK